MATVDLGAIRFNWKGAYAGGTAYVVDDVVSSGGSSYMCILASTGNATSNATYWSVMAQGADVATTLTTQGDVLFRDASGIQRLAKGTAGQVLKVNSGATAPEWGTDSLDLTADQSWTGSQRATLVVDNDGSFDMNLGQNFKCTPAAPLTLTFTNFANGQSGFIILVNSGGHAIARHADSIADANFVATVSAAGTYIISYISDGADAFLTNSAIMA
jgi:hypothetical protein